MWLPAQSNVKGHPGKTKQVKKEENRKISRKT